jgi:hypothetical protein
LYFFQLGLGDADANRRINREQNLPLEDELNKCISDIKTEKVQIENAIKFLSPKQDFVFRFPLDRIGRKVLYEDKLVELIRQQLENLLDVVILTSEGKEVKVDGFKLLVDLDTEYRIYDQDNKAGTL